MIELPATSHRSLAIHATNFGDFLVHHTASSSVLDMSKLDKCVIMLSFWMHQHNLYSTWSARVVMNFNQDGSTRAQFPVRDLEHYLYSKVKSKCGESRSNRRSEDNEEVFFRSEFLLDVIVSWRKFWQRIPFVAFYRCNEKTPFGMHAHSHVF